MKNTKIFGLLISLVLIFGLAFTACVNNIDIERQSDNNPEESLRRDTLVLQKAQENHTIAVEELSQIVLSAFNQTREDQTAMDTNSITRTRNVPAAHRQRFESRGRNNRGSGGGNRGRSIFLEEETVYEEHDIELLEFSIREGNGDEWFVLGSTDSRIGHILTITQSSLESSDSELALYLRERINAYIEDTIYEYNTITEEEIEYAVLRIDAEQRQYTGAARVAGDKTSTAGGAWIRESSTTNLSIIKYPLLATLWGQGTAPRPASGVAYSYNTYIQEYFKQEHRKHGQHPNWNRYIAGCGPVAVAQLITYHGYMNYYYRPGNLTHMPYDFETKALGKWTGRPYNGGVMGYDFAMINNRYADGKKGTSPTITDTYSSCEERGQVAALMYHVFRELNATPKATYKNGIWTVGTTINNRDIDTMLKNFGYDIEWEGSPTTVTGTANSFSLRYHIGLDKIRNAIDRGLPIIARGQTQSGNGHIWVIDGYGQMSRFTEVYQHETTGQNISRTIWLTGNTLMVHCNMGWNGNSAGYSGGDSPAGGQYNGWYVYGIFNATQIRENPTTENIASGARNYSTNTRLILAKPR